MWYHIKARDMGIYKPNGKVITFWLWGDSEDHIRDLLSKKNILSKEDYTKKSDTLRKKVIDYQSQRRTALDKIAKSYIVE